MAKKQVVNKPHSINKEVLNEFTKINFDNIKHFFNYSDSLFLYIIEDGNKKDGIIYSIGNQFNVRSRFIKGTTHISTYIYSNELKTNKFTIFTSESEEDYNGYISDLKVLIKGYIESKSLYGKRIQ